MSGRQPGVANADLLAIRAQLQGAMARCDRLLAMQHDAGGNVAEPLGGYRLSPGGPLSAEGVREVNRRLALGETNAVIARDMGITVQAVAKRRAAFGAQAAQRRHPGALRGKFTMAADFDELPPEELTAMENSAP